MAKNQKSRFADQAALEGLVKFGPELAVLKEAQRTAKATYDQRVQTADSGALGVQQAVAAALPAVAHIYDQAGLDQARTSQTLIGHDLAGLGGVADSIKGGAALEAAGMANRLGEARAAAVRDFADRGVQAQAGAVQAKRSAQDELVTSLAKILQTSRDLGGQQGAFEAATIGDLEHDAAQDALKTSLNEADNSQSERNSLRSAGIDPNTGAAIPGGKLDPKVKRGGTSATGVKLLSGEKHVAARDTVARAVAALRTLDPDKSDRGEAAPLLVTGHKSTPLYNPDGSKRISKSGSPVTTPDIPAAGALATIAADVYYDGHLSRANQKVLADLGYSLRQLGLPTYAQWKRAQKAQGRAKAAPRGKAGSVFAAPLGRQTLGG